MVWDVKMQNNYTRIVRHMYTNIKYCVNSWNSYTEYFKCAVGVGKGEVVSPILFSLFIDDLELFAMLCKLWSDI